MALARDEGEGREIQVRGLNSTFTRVRIDGMEAMSTVGGEDSQSGTNRGRAFDFNVFASDLFSGITVHKSASADLEEGSLGATVDLTTAHPFDHQGFTLALSGQAGYANQGGEFNPRFTGLISDTFMGGKLGILFSAAFDSRNTLQLGFDTTRFENDNTQQNLRRTPNRWWRDAPRLSARSSTAPRPSVSAPWRTTAHHGLARCRRMPRLL